MWKNPRPITEDYYAGTPALIRNQYGKGEAYYFGGAFALDTAKVFLEKLEVAGPYSGKLSLPGCCELAVRKKEGKKYLFVLNYASEAVKINVKEEMREFFADQKVSGEVELGAYEVKIFVGWMIGIDQREKLRKSILGNQDRRKWRQELRTK